MRGHTAACCIQRPTLEVVYNDGMNEPSSSPCSLREEDLRTTPATDKETRTTMFKIKSANTILYCENWEACVHFYKEILNFRVTFAKEDWFRELEMNSGARISVANVKRCTIPSSAGEGITLSWQVDELEPLRDHLLGNGIKVSEIKSHSWRAPWFYAWDPEGTRIEFWKY